MSPPRRIRITQIDGKLPNLAGMNLLSYHRAMGDEVIFRRVTFQGRRPIGLVRDLADLERYDVVYGCAIFEKSAPLVERFRAAWPGAIVGGSGSGSPVTVEEVIGRRWEGYDYSPYPEFKASIGFSQRGCRLDCGHCAVRNKEGQAHAVGTIAGIHRGPGHPKLIHLLDNDFFGQKEWRARLAEIRDGEYRVCFNQGINLRIITQEQADALASVEYRDDSFTERRIYAAWDNLADEGPFFRGLEKLVKAGIPAGKVMAYMLVGFDPEETWERVFYRFDRMVAAGIEPYPMPYEPCAWDARGADPRGRGLKDFQRWVVTGLYRAKPPKAVPWAEYDASVKRPPASRIRPGRPHQAAFL